MATHLAATCVGKDQPFSIQSRPTPQPSPGELLIAVKSVALNPADWIVRDMGVIISNYPTVIGFDISGIVLEIGEGVPTGDDGKEPTFVPGLTRVAAYAAFAWRLDSADYGAFQERCLVPWQHATPIPDDGISWNEAATLPVAVQVPLSIWDRIGVPRLGESGGKTDGNESRKEVALLVWGASSSVGSMGVQTARVLLEEPGSNIGAVYATAGAANVEYIKSLGANRVFDYKDPELVGAIVAAAKEDGLVIRHCCLAMGDVVACQTVLKSFTVDGQDRENETAKIGSAPPVPENLAKVEGVDIIFVQPSMNDEQERLSQFRYWIGTWLKERLASGSIKASPKLRVVGKGVQAINSGLDTLKKGVSCTKLVVEVAE